MATIGVLGHAVRTDTLLQVLFDFGFIIIGIFIGVAWVGSGLPVDIASVLIYSSILAATMIMLSVWLGFYERVHYRRLIDTQARAVLALHLSVPIAYLLFVLIPGVEANRQFLEIAGMAALFGVLARRVRISHKRDSAFVVSRLLVFGVGNEAKQVAESIHHADPTVAIIGYYPANKEETVGVPEEDILPATSSLVDTAIRLKADQIVVAVGDRRGGMIPLREMLDCRVAGIRVLDRATYFEQMLGQVRLDSVTASWLIFGEGFSQGLIRTLAKRVFDILCATILLILASPVMIVAALLVMIEDGFPVLYRQERVGLGGRLFNVIKFRSMRKDAEADGKPRWATSNDNRVTRTGKIFRKLRIDELPQLFSVLKGDMSMVGPRPERAFFVDQLTQKIPFYALRHSVKPGVTGWAQVRYHYGASEDDAAMKLQYDLYYVKNHSLLLDIMVMFETVAVVLGGKGAQ